MVDYAYASYLVIHLLPKTKITYSIDVCDTLDEARSKAKELGKKYPYNRITIFNSHESYYFIPEDEKPPIKEAVEVNDEMEKALSLHDDIV